MGLLDGKVAIITGASRGIGKAIAQTFIAQGATVAFTYLSSDEKAKALENELTANGGTAKGFKSNAAEFDAAQKLADEVMESFGAIDILVNNAGITRDGLLMRMNEEQWDEDHWYEEDTRSSWYRSHVNNRKEAEKIVLAQLGNASMFLSWWRKTCEIIAACSVEPTEPNVWILK